MNRKRAEDDRLCELMLEAERRNLESEMTRESTLSQEIRRHLQAAAQAALELHHGEVYAWSVIERELDLLHLEWEENNPNPNPQQLPPYTKQPISQSIRKRVFERDAYRCVKCGSHLDLCVDHIIPESKGGPSTMENYQTLCRPCNTAKGNREA